MWRADDASVKILGAEYQLYMQLKKILGEYSLDDVLDFFQEKRKVRKIKKKEKLLKNIV